MPGYPRGLQFARPVKASRRRGNGPPPRMLECIPVGRASAVSMKRPVPLLIESSRPSLAVFRLVPGRALSINAKTAERASPLRMREPRHRDLPVRLTIFSPPSALCPFRLLAVKFFRSLPTILPYFRCCASRFPSSLARIVSRGEISLQPPREAPRPETSQVKRIFVPPSRLPAVFLSRTESDSDFMFS